MSALATRRKAQIQGSSTDALRERLTQRKAQRMGRQIGFMDWANKVPEPKSGPLNFDYFPFQVELYEQGAQMKEAVVMKCTQVGVSAWAMRWALYHADTAGRTGLYVFPTSKDMWDFSTLRIKPLIDGSNYLSSRKTPDDPDNKGMKGVGTGMVVFRGSESKRGLDSVDADHIVFDEYDTLNSRNIPDAEMRVSSPLSPGLIRRVGVPMYPEEGIDEMYNQSDARRWLVKCEHCSDWQDLDFWKNVDMKTAQRVCSSCRKPLDVSTGHWVPQFPDREVRGYHINRMISPYVDLSETIKLSKSRSPVEKQVFMNKHLGLAWAPSEGRLTSEAIMAAQAAGGGYGCVTRVEDALPVASEMTTMGIDVATVRDLNVRISRHFMDGGIEKKKALFIGTVGDFSELDRLFMIFGVHMAAIDHMPDGRLARAFAERHPGQVYVVSYDGNPTPTNSNVIVPDDDMMHVRVNRVAALDATFEEVRQQRNLLPVNLPEGYVEQMRTPTKISEEDEFGKKKIVYRSKRPDDFAHAEVYDVVAHDLYIRRLGLDEMLVEESKPLDDMIDFERSGLADHDHGDGYHSGPGQADDDYFAGPS